MDHVSSSNAQSEPPVDEEAPILEEGRMPNIELTNKRRRQLMKLLHTVEAAEFEDKEVGDDGKPLELEDLLALPIPPKRGEFVQDPSGERLIIWTIFVENFKSYKGRHQLGPLHKNLTMIVGPNGSGKSNVIDALLFVFGFKNSKIRTKKLSSLIHSYGNRQSCTVEIHFQMIKDIDDEKYEVIPNSSFVISRTVNRSDQSTYKINNVVAKQEEVQLLLHKCGIDTNHNRFLILQGEVEAIALMKPTSKHSNKEEEGMLEYIEGIVGTDRFVEPIGKMNERLKHYEIKMSQFGAGVRRAGETANKFWPVAKGCVAFLNAYNEQNYLNGLNFMDSICEHNITRDHLQKAIDEKQQLFDQTLERKRKALISIDKYTRKITRSTAKQALVECETIDNQTKLGKLLADDSVLKKKVKAANENWRISLEERATARKNVTDLILLPEECDANISRVKLEIEQLQEKAAQSKAAAEAGLQKFELKAVAERKKQNDYEALFAEKNRALVDVRGAALLVDAELREMRIVAGKGGQQLERTQESLAKFEKMYREESEELEKLKHEILPINAQLSECKIKIPGLEASERNARAQRVAAKHKLDDAEPQQKDEFYDEITSALRGFKEKGMFPGYLGRLGDLGVVKSICDGAISTVSSGRLDLQVVEKDADCDLGVQLLLDNEIGRASFFSLEHLAKTRYTPRKCPNLGNSAEHIVKHITCEDKRVWNMFDYFFGDMVMVNTLSEATRIQKKLGNSWRGVTVDGTVVDTCGSLTGGGRTKFGRMRTEGSKRGLTPAEIHKLQKEYSAAKSVHMKIEKQLSDNITLRDSLEPRRKYTEDRIEELKKNIPEHSKQINRLRVDKLELEQAVSSPHIDVTQEQIEEKKAHLAELHEQERTLNEEVTGAEKQIAACQAKLNKMYYEMTKKHTECVDKSAERITKLEDEILKLEATKRGAASRLLAARRMRERAEEKVEDLKKALNELEALEADQNGKLIRDLKFDIEVNQGSAKLLCEQLAFFERMKAAADAELALCQKEGQTFKAIFDELNGTLHSVNNEYDAAKDALKKINDSWIDPVDLAPGLKIISSKNDEELLTEMVNDECFVILPPEIENSVNDYKTPWMSIYKEGEDVRPPPDSLKPPAYMANLEKSLETFRRTHDERGIFDYSLVQTLLSYDTNEFNKVKEKIRTYRERLNLLRQMRHQEFSEALAFLGTTTQMLYQMITNGGDASLKFVEEGKSSDPFDAGIKFSVRPAKKSWKLIENLSGGEKTLASLCFVFAMHHYRATPLYVMDEIDAALDLNNVRLIANYIKHSDKTRNAQFMVISLRNQMFEVGNRLIGIYKVDGCTNNVVIAPDRVESTNRPRKQTLDEKIREETKKKHAVTETEADSQNEIVAGVKNMAIKRRRKLGRILLSDFGLDECENEDPTPSGGQVLQVHTLDEDGTDEEEEEPVRRRKRTQVAEEFDREDDEWEDEATPPPPVVKKPSERARRKSKKQ